MSADLEAETSRDIAGARVRRPAAETAPPGGFWGTVRYAWAILTSMRTAIFLLLALAVASMPGGLLPQRPSNPFAVTIWIAEHPTAGPLLDKIGMFDVFASPWFAAIYLLLFISLVGCIVPRCAVYARALRAPAASPPRPVDRLGSARAYAAPAQPDAVLAAARDHLAARRYRVKVDGDTVSGERGYTRELGNLLFHVALLGVLLSIFGSSWFGYKGTVAVVEGQGFANTLTQYDDLAPGGGFTPAKLTPFTLQLDTFTVRYETGEVQRGAAREFAADVQVTDASGTRPATIRVNQPLRIGDTSVHLVGHGYAPVVTVRDAAGNVAYSGPTIFQPLDGNMRSAGVINARDARPQRLAFEGYFLPTAVVDQQGPRSLFPDAIYPELFLNAWSGPPVAETGVATSVYTLDKTGLTQMRVGNDLARLRLRPGDTYVLPDRAGTVTFEGYQRWAKLQVSRQPGMPVILFFVGLAVAGMALSLSVRPRRIWLRAADDYGQTVLHVAGVDRVDGRSGVAEDAAALAAAVGGQPLGVRDDPAAAEGREPRAGEQDEPLTASGVQDGRGPAPHEDGEPPSSSDDRSDT